MAWYDLSANPKVMHGYYSAPSALDRMDLRGFAFRADGQVFSLEADLMPFPDMPSKRWPVGANTARIEIALWLPRSLTIEGLAPDMPAVFSLEHVSNHRLRFSFLSDAIVIRGECMAVRIEGITGYVKGAEPSAYPNGGPATPSGNPSASEGPPSVS
jgi:hypothetical protein